ncbi:MAG: hypothetical protein V1647_06295, partial [Pseudomonadota bacterium]
PIAVIVATKISLKDKKYGGTILDAITVLAVASVVMVSIIFNNDKGLMSHNPFSLLAFLAATISVPLLRNNDKNKPLGDISRSTALNIYLVSIFTSSENFIVLAGAAVAINFLQFVLTQTTPMFNIFQKIRYSAQILISLSLLSLLGSIIWAIY